MIWLSPAFPVGAFAYSHGLEWAAEDGKFDRPAALEDWLRAMATHGSLKTDLLLLAASWRAATNADDRALIETAELAAALQPTGERRLEATQQGASFLAQIRAAWPTAAVDRLTEVWPGPIAYPVAVGVAAGGHAVDLAATLEAYGLAFVSNLVSASIRLSVVGQTDGQRIIAALAPTLSIAARRAGSSTLADVGSAGWSADLASLRHETQYTRLFRS